jgi:methionyl-tRNA formyltransferase
VTSTGPGRRPVRTVFLGSGDFGVPALRALVDHPEVDVVGVVSAAPRPAGRGMTVTGTPVATAATRLGLDRILTPTRLRAPEAIADVLGLEADLAVLADYGQIVPAALLGSPHGALNLHPSLLPRHRGASPVPATILAGDEETGVSLMLMDAGLDTGPLIAIERVGLRGSEIAPELEAHLADLGAGLLARSLAPWLAGELEGRPQPVDGVTLTRPLRREDGRLDPTRSAVELERQVRAYQQWPASFVDTDAGRLAVWRAEVGGDASRRVGQFGPDGFSTSRGELLLLDVQPAGGRRMSWDAFVRGRPAIVGSRAVPAR